jgi:hypothetical protein
MIPWIIFAVVVVPLVVIAFIVSRRKTQAGEAEPQTAESQARTEREFAAAEAYEAEWHEGDKERFHDERLP